MSLEEVRMMLLSRKGSRSRRSLHVASLTLALLALVCWLTSGGRPKVVVGLWGVEMFQVHGRSA